MLFALAFLLAAAAAALATAISTWLALLLVGAGLFLLAGLLGMLALGRIKKGTPPVPEQAIREAKLTQTALKSDSREKTRFGCVMRNLSSSYSMYVKLTGSSAMDTW